MIDVAKSQVRKTRQRAVGIPDPLWEQAMTIARLLDEKDDIGEGLPVVVRRSLTRYVARHKALLDAPTPDE